MNSSTRNSPTDDVLQALLDLERTAQPMQRGAERKTVRTEVTLLPANTIDRPGNEQLGVAQDASRTGCRLVTPLPPAVGSVYCLKFDANSPLGVQFARCLRCHMIKEDIYEAAFAFFTPLEEGTDQRHDLADLV